MVDDFSADSCSIIDNEQWIMDNGIILPRADGLRQFFIAVARAVKTFSGTAS